MAGLVGYASSDEGSDNEEQNSPQEQPIIPQPIQEISKPEHAKQAEAAAGPSQPSPTPPTTSAEQTSSQPEPQIGPSLGPSLPSANDKASLPEAPPSPSSYRALIQDLTLPSIPDFDIPPSPPGSPPPTTHKKFEQFITLKKRGTHFNAKLESSTATRNPSLMDKLLGFVDVTGGAQYQSTLSRELWDPSAFPDSAYRTRLRRAQDRIAKEKDSERTGGGRASVEFVPSVGLSRGNKRRLDNDID